MPISGVCCAMENVGLSIVELLLYFMSTPGLCIDTMGNKMAS